MCFSCHQKHTILQLDFSALIRELQNNNNNHSHNNIFMEAMWFLQYEIGYMKWFTHILKYYVILKFSLKNLMKYEYIHDTIVNI